LILDSTLSPVSSEVLAMVSLKTAWDLDDVLF
jgi:hypothetical protein